MPDTVLQLARALIQRRSLTPDDAGCQNLIAERLEAAGFGIRHLRFGQVDNLWAEAGSDGPLLCLAGHTDVVPPGPLEDWTYDPFAAAMVDGTLHGRGAADMKSSLAALVVAAENFRAAHPDHAGRLAFLITSDEEGPAIDGTRAVVNWLAEQNKHIEYCLIGEPSSETVLGDTLKNGRRGSLNARLRVRGRQGHVAYPHRADNALHRILPVLAELAARRWDDGDAFFPPTSFQISSVHAGSHAENVIPGVADAAFNWRFSPLQSQALIRAEVEARCREHDIDPSGIEWRLSGSPFITEDGPLIDAARASIVEHTGIECRLSTGGGTSDGRYIAPAGAQVVEIGPCNDTIHQANERIRADDLERLVAIYEGVISRLLGPCKSGRSA